MLRCTSGQVKAVRLYVVSNFNTSLLNGGSASLRFSPLKFGHHLLGEKAQRAQTGFMSQAADPEHRDQIMDLVFGFDLPQMCDAIRRRADDPELF